MIEAHPFGSPRPTRSRRALARRFLAFAPLLGGLALALAACSPPAESLHEGHGTAVEVDAAARTVTLDHQEIPGLMKGMTMTFAVAPEVDLAAIAPGAKVDFRLKSAGSSLTVTEIRPTAP